MLQILLGFHIHILKQFDESQKKIVAFDIVGSCYYVLTSTWSKSSWPAYSRPKDTEKYQLMIKVEKVNFVRAMASLIMTNACSFFWFLAKNTMMVVDDWSTWKTDQAECCAEEENCVTHVVEVEVLNAEQPISMYSK